MLKLYGFAVSNYFNMVKHALLEKGVEFEEITVFPDQSAEYLAKSPMGKVPCIETEQGFLCETTVILDYLESTFPQKPLLPEGAWEQAKVRELVKVSELYIELSGRRLLPALLAGAPVSEGVQKEVREVMTKGLRAVDTLASYSPFLLGEQQTLADIVLRYSLGVAKLGAGSVLKWDLFEGHAELKAWDERMAQNPICQQLDAAMQAQFDEFLKKVNAK